MTNRVNALTVALAHDAREDDVQALIGAIEQLRGVIKVTANIVTPDSFVAEQRARNELGRKLMEIVYPPDKQ